LAHLFYIFTFFWETANHRTRQTPLRVFVRGFGFPPQSHRNLPRTAKVLPTHSASQFLCQSDRRVIRVAARGYPCPCVVSISTRLLSLDNSLFSLSLGFFAFTLIISRQQSVLSFAWVFCLHTVSSLLPLPGDESESDTHAYTRADFLFYPLLSFAPRRTRSRTPIVDPLLRLRKNEPSRNS
jgi:hypothetical protein